MDNKLNIIFLGPAYPYRGGLAMFIETLAKKFQQKGNHVKIFTFTLQYPSFFFPGKSQFSESEPPVDLNIIRKVNSINPFNWLAVGKKIYREKPDILIMKYWLPLMAPCFGTIARIVRMNKHTKIIVQLDNIIPHEKRFLDNIFTRYFISACHGFIYMSEQVKKDLQKFTTKKPSSFAPHPVYDIYGDAVGKETACRCLGIESDIKYGIFFGFIRDYKGLDVLIEAWKILKDNGKTNNKKLLVAGEFYNDKKKYISQIKNNGLDNDILIFDRFINDEDVKYYFSASNLLIQPYKTATQSGVTQIAYHFDLPMVVTNVGGLAELIPDNKVGFVTATDASHIAVAIEKYFTENKETEFRENIRTEKKRFSWENMTGEIITLYEKIVQKQ